MFGQFVIQNGGVNFVVYDDGFVYVFGYYYLCVWFGQMLQDVGDLVYVVVFWCGGYGSGCFGMGGQWLFGGLFYCVVDQWIVVLCFELVDVVQDG